MRPERSGYVIAHSAVTEDVTLKAFTAPMLPELPPCDGWFACGVDYFYPIGPAKLPGGVKAVALIRAMRLRLSLTARYRLHHASEHQARVSVTTARHTDSVYSVKVIKPRIATRFMLSLSPLSYLLDDKSVPE